MLKLRQKLDDTVVAGQTAARRRWLLQAIACLAAVWATWNASVTAPAALALLGSNAPAAVAYREDFLRTDTIVVDLRGPASALSVGAADRSLFLIAQSLSGFDFEAVTLARHGEARLTLDGRRFQEIGLHAAARDTDALAVDVLTLHEAVIDRHAGPQSSLPRLHVTSGIAAMVAAHEQLHQLWWSELRS